MVHVTRGLVVALLDFASDAEPSPVSIGLATTPAADLLDEGVLAEDVPGEDLDPETPVFTDFYFPDAGGAVSAVFGMDLGTPAGQTDGRFVSHPQGRLGLQRTDDLHAVVLVAVPPWEVESVAAFDRSGRRQSLDLIEGATEHDTAWEG